MPKKEHFKFNKQTFRITVKYTSKYKQIDKHNYI